MNRLQRLFSDNWAVRRQDMDSFMSLLLPGIISGNLQGAAALLNADKAKAAVASGPYRARWWEFDDVSIPVDSVAVLTLRGMLYSWESEWIADMLSRAVANPNICGIVLDIDGPGGMISHLDIAARAVAECPKPVATVVTGIMASAHFWLGSSAERIFVASPLCEVGSVGVMMTHCSFREYFRMNGIDYREIYPDSADLKNKEVRALEDEGDESLVKDHAARLHRLFADTVAGNLDIAYDPELPLFRGEMFMASEALELGYVDEAGSLDDAMRWVLARATLRRAEQMI